MTKIDFNLHGLNCDAYLIGTEGREIGIIFYARPVNSRAPINIRLHSACCFSEIFGATDCDCNQQMMKFIDLMKSYGGVLLYLFQEGRGHGLSLKFKGYKLSQTQSLDTVDAYNALGISQDARDYSIALNTLKPLLDTHEMIVHTNNPRKINALKKAGFHVTRSSMHLPNSSDAAQKYVDTKIKKLGHIG